LGIPDYDEVYARMRCRTAVLQQRHIGVLEGVRLGDLEALEKAAWLSATSEPLGGAVFEPGEPGFDVAAYCVGAATKAQRQKSPVCRFAAAAAGR